MHYRRPRILGVVLSISLGVLLAQAAHAQSTWTGTVNQDWENSGNWSSSPNPPTGNFTINTSTGNYPIITASSFNIPIDVILADGGTNTARLDHRDGSIFLQDTGAAGNWFIVGRSANTAAATYNLANTAVSGLGVSGFGQGTGDIIVGKFFVGGTSTNNLGTGTVNINTTGSITANSTAAVSGSAASINLGYGAGAAGTINLESGTINSTGQIWVGTMGTGVINQTGGTVNATGIVLLARNINATQAGSGTYNISGSGVLNSENDLVVAYAGSDAAVGTMNVNNGGTVNIATTTKRWLIVNQWDPSHGNLNVNGGTINLNANTDIRFSTGNNGSVGASVVNLNSGSINAWGGNGVGSGDSNAVVDLNRNAQVAGANNTFNLNGGTLQIGGVETFRDQGTAVFNFNGGILKAAQNNANFFVLGGASQRANVRNGGAKIDSNGKDITMAEALLHSNVGGDNAIDGGLTKSGTGTLTMTAAAHTYTGATVVSGGGLLMAGTTATSGVTVNGATFGNSLAATPLTVSALTIGAPGSTLSLNLPAAAAGLTVTNALNTGGNTTTVNATKAAWTNGVNPLLNFGTLNGMASQFTVGTLTGLNIRQVAGGITNTGNGLAVTINGDSPRWTGAVSGEWSTATIANPKNWKLITGGGNTDYLEGDAVLFDDLATGTTTVDITSATGVLPTSVVVDNTTKAYTINATGGSGINGATSLVKSGTNSLTLNSNNGYTGGTTINGGTVNVNTATALGTGAVTIAAGGSAKTLNNTSGLPVVMTTNNAQAWNDDLTFTGSNDGLSDLDMGSGAVTIGGAGTTRTVTVSAGTFHVGELTSASATMNVVKQGTGTLALSSAGTNVAGTNIAGTLNVAQGTVQINRAGTSGTTSGDLFVGGLAGTGSITNGAGDIRWAFVNQAEATTSTFNGTLDNGPGAALGLVKRGNGTLTLGGANTMSDQVTLEGGTTNFTGSGSLLNAVSYTLAAGTNAVFQIDSSARLGAGVININSSGAGFGPGAGSTAQLQLSGNAALSNPITLAQRNDTNGGPAIRNMSANNSLNGLITIVTGGSWARVQSDAGLLTLGGGVTTSAASARRLVLQGAGNGVVSGAIADNGLDPLGLVHVIKEGAGVWTLSGANTYTGNTVVSAGTLTVTQPNILADTSAVSLFQGGTLNLTTGSTDTVNFLYLNGQSMTPGVYNSSNSMGLITGTGSLTVLNYDLPGDFDNNGTVNADDLTVWQTGMTAVNAVGDTNGDTFTNGADFLIWQRNLGASFPTVGATAAVPEPATLLGACVTGLALAAAGRKRRVA